METSIQLQELLRVKSRMNDFPLRRTKTMRSTSSRSAAATISSDTLPSATLLQSILLFGLGTALDFCFMLNHFN
jgi:hypothetical protein